ncbi:MAG: NAD-dependent epimerase/dehydratase family protein [Candidatus Thorarchaeota archaeon]
MKILVTGGGGYLGCILIPLLLEKGYDIYCLDKLFFGVEPIKPFIDKIILKKEDLRTFNKSFLKGIDVCIHLAAISQPDQAEVIDPRLFYEINHYGSTRLAKLCKANKIDKFIFTSTCSVYGFQNEILNETSIPNPLEAYGKSKLLAEQDLLSLADENFNVTILRPATMYGFSPKMRFDLVVNGMTWSLYKFRKINVMRDGTQWRPNVHVKDVARLICTLVETNKEKVQNQIYNVGSNDQNYQILPLAKLIGDSTGNDYELAWYGETDKRSYRVDFSKLESQLTFKLKFSIKEGSKNIYNALNDGIIEKNKKTSIIDWYKKLYSEHTIKLEHR